MKPIAPLRDFILYARYAKVHRIALLAAFVMLVIGISTGFGVASSNTRSKAYDEDARRVAIFSEWQEKITANLARSSMLAAALAAFAKSSATEPMNFSASTMERVKIIQPDAFNDVCKDLYDANSGIATLQLQSGAVVSQVYPPNSSWLYTDIMLQPQFSSYEEMFRTGKGVTIGPLRLFESFNGDYCFVIRSPVFVGSNKTRNTFWGIGNVIITINGFLKALEANELMKEQRFDYALWFVANGTAGHTLVAFNNGSNAERTIEKGMRMSLPISERGKESFFAIYSQDVTVSYQIPALTIAQLVLGTLFGTLGVVLLFYVILFLAFIYRHRYAPQVYVKGEAAPTFSTIVTLKGVQQLLDACPNEAQEMLNQFLDSARWTAHKHKCYVVCDVGDRALYVVSSDVNNIIEFSRDVISNTNLYPNSLADLASSLSPSFRGRGSPVPHHRTTSALSMITSDDEGMMSPTASSVKNIVACHASGFIAIDTHQHTARYYDAQRDVYFYGASRTLKCIGTSLDELQPGELGWTMAFNTFCDTTPNTQKKTLPQLRAMRSLRSLYEKGKVTAYVVGWWGSIDDEEEEEEEEEEESLFAKRHDNNSEPSLAMTILNDFYVKQMTTLLVGTGKRRDSIVTKSNIISPLSKTIGTKKQHRTSAPDLSRDLAQKDSPLSNTLFVINSPLVSTEGDTDPRHRSDDYEDTYLLRFGTLLLLQIEGDPRASLGTIQRVAEENRGTVVSAFDNTVAVTFNIMVAGGHHQLRAADTVVGLRSALSMQFIGCIFDGKVGALVSEGIIMCTGEVTSAARALLAKTNKMASLYESPSQFHCLGETSTPAKTEFQKPDRDEEADREDLVMAVCTVDEMMRSNADGELRSPDSVAASTPSVQAHDISPLRRVPKGFCLLYCFGEMSSRYDCEAIDVEFIRNVTTTGDTKEEGADNNTEGSRQQSAVQILYRLGEPKVNQQQQQQNKNEKAAGIGAAAAAAQQHLAAIGMAGPSATTLASDVAGCDEWMYCLKDDESSFSVANAIFEKLRIGDLSHAREMYWKLKNDTNFATNVSICAKTSLFKHLGK